MPVKKVTPKEKPGPARVERAKAPAASREGLQSAIEELKTSREKLRSLNEELEAEINQRQSAERALRTSEQKFRALFQDAPVGIVQSDSRDGRILMVNPCFCAMTGYSEAELLARTFLEITHPEDRTSSLEGFFRMESGKIPGYQTEKRYIRKDGSTLWADLKVILVRDVQGRPLHTLAVIFDITERNRLRSQLTERGTQLQHERNFIDAILNTVAALIVVFDSEGRLVQCNKACSAATGYDFSEFQGNSKWQVLIPPDEMEGVQRVLERLQSGEDHVQYENHWLRRDGSRFLLCWSNSVLRDEAGQVQYIIATGIDITDQHKAETRARETLETASRLQRLQTANELATLLAHELNQPLAAIANYAEAGQLLLRHPPLEQDKLTRNLQQISQQSLRAGDAIKHLRAFVGRGRIDPVPLDLNAVVRNTCTLMAPRARSRGIEIVIELDDALPQVMGVEVHLEQVLLNLIRNAIDAIRDAKMKSGVITVTTRQQEGMAQVSVCDSGPGIDAERADTLFEPLASHKKYGLGFGLRISRSLIEAHGGRLWVVPHNPGGIFHFVLLFAP